jgi:hypothetical protein
MFEQASRLKLRFETAKGYLSVEDLWDLPLRSLNTLAIALHHQLKNENVSFLDDDQKPDPIVQLRFDVARHVIEVRKEDKRRADQARERAETKQKLLGIVARKEDAELEGKSVEELRALIGSL